MSHKNVSVLFMTLQWCISYYCFWSCKGVSGRENINGSYQMQWFHQIKIFFFFLTKDISYPWYHRCISFFQICFPVVTLWFSSSNTPEGSCTHMHLWYWGWKGSEKSKCLCRMSAIIIPSKISGNSIKYFAFTFLATDMSVIIWPPRESEKASNFFLNFWLILNFRRQIILIGFF